METNGWVLTRGYRTAAEPAWVDPFLHVTDGPESNVVRDVQVWRLMTGEYLAAYLTDVHVVLVNLTANQRLGYAFCPNAGGFHQATELNGHLYLADEGRGVYRLNWRTMQENSTPSDWEPFLSLTTQPALLADEVTGIYGFNGDGLAGDGGEHAGFLAVCSRVSGRPGIYQAEIVDLETGISHRAAPWWRHLSPRKVSGLGSRLYFVCGNTVAVKYDGTELSAGKNGWLADATVCGTVSEDFADGEMSAGWLLDDRHGASACRIYELQMQTAAEGDGTPGYVFLRRNALIAGELTAYVSLETAWPVDANDHVGQVSLQIHFPHGEEQVIALQRRREMADGVVTDRLSALQNGVEIGSIDFPIDRYWLRFDRTMEPAAETSSLRLSGGGFGYGAGQTVATLDGLPAGPIALNLYVRNDSQAIMDCRFHVLDDHQEFNTAYRGMPRSDITALALAATTTEDATVVFAGFRAGLWACQTDESRPGLGEGNGRCRGGYAANQANFNVLPGEVNAVDALSCSALAGLRRDTYGLEEIVGYGRVAVGTAAGLTEIDLTNDSVVFSADPGTVQPLVDPRVQSLSSANGYAYGTPDGGGFVNPDEEAPDDTEVYFQEFGQRILLGWRLPTNPDYLGSRLYRAANIGSDIHSEEWLVLRRDGFGGGGKEVLFGANHAFFDETLEAYGRYRYKVAHLDQMGHESAGTVITAYVDEPVISSVIVNNGEPAVYRRGIELAIIGNSGPASGAATGQIGWIKIREIGHDQHTAPLIRYEDDKVYPFVLSPGQAGQFVTRALEVVPYSHGLIQGRPYQLLVRFQDYDTEETAAVTTPPASFVLAYEFSGDSAAVSDVGGQADYPAANVLDPRLGVKWRSAQTGFASLTLDFGRFVPLRYLALLGHNFDSFVRSSGELRVTLVCTESANGVETVGRYNLTRLAGQPTLVADLAGKNIDRLTLEMSFDPEGYGSCPAFFQLGRLLAIGEGAGFVQPVYNFAADFSWGVKEYARLFAAPGARYAANPVYVRTAEIRLEDFRPDQREPLLQAFRQAGRHDPVFVLLKPEQVQSVAALSLSESAPAEDCLAVYGYFGDEQQNWRIRGDDYGTTVLRIEEAGE